MEFIYYFLGFFLILGIILLITSIIEIIGLYKVYKKAGYNGWEVFIPFYNSWILLKISELNSWYYLALISPIILSLTDIEELTLLSSLCVLVTNFFIYYNISKKFEKDLFFAILLVLFPFVMIPILGFSKNCIYNKNIKVSEHGPIKDNSTQNNYNQNNTTKNNYCCYCGNQLDKNANFCRYCGNKINEN